MRTKYTAVSRDFIWPISSNDTKRLQSTEIHRIRRGNRGFLHRRRCVQSPSKQVEFQPGNPAWCSKNWVSLVSITVWHGEPCVSRARSQREDGRTRRCRGPRSLRQLLRCRARAGSSICVPCGRLLTSSRRANWRTRSPDFNCASVSPDESAAPKQIFAVKNGRKLPWTVATYLVWVFGESQAGPSPRWRQRLKVLPFIGAADNKQR